MRTVTDLSASTPASLWWTRPGPCVWVRIS